MEGKVKIDLGEVQKTLLIPLFGRAVDYESPKSLLKDRYAYEIVQRLDYEFKGALAKAPAQHVINCAVRAYHLDAALLQVIARHPDATVINIGAGLDTAFHRVDNGKIYWYDLDLPDTIELRRKMIPEGERNRYIAKSVFDRTWFKDVEVRGSKVFMMAAGVLVYLPEGEIKKLFVDLAREFPGGEIMFDAYSRTLLRMRNKAIKGERMRSELFIPHQWGIGAVKEFEAWSDRIKVVDAFPYYSRIDLGQYWDRRLLAPLKVLNFFRVIKMVRLRFE